MDRKQIDAWLRETDVKQLDRLWLMADTIRNRTVDDAIHLRGLVEFSNHCVRDCGYCGLRAANLQLKRYRMSEAEILDCAHRAVKLGFGTVVLQSGEDPLIEPKWMSQVLHRIKKETNLVVTLSLGEQTYDKLALWRESGADRYLLRFETSNQELFHQIHPSHQGIRRSRIDILMTLHELGYEVGSGVMIAIPGQSYDDLARSVELFAELNLHMIGAGPYVPDPETPLGKAELHCPEKSTFHEQVPNSELMTYKVLALARLVCPESNIPSTTALATLSGDMNHELGLKRGANVVMPNITPVEYRRLYQIYPNKAYANETSEKCYENLKQKIEEIGRTIGSGRGDSIRLSKQ